MRRQRPEELFEQEDTTSSDESTEYDTDENTDDNSDNMMNELVDNMNQLNLRRSARLRGIAPEIQLVIPDYNVNRILSQLDEIELHIFQSYMRDHPNLDIERQLIVLESIFPEKFQ